jgi:ABC-2 type transport system ATP-binding protein
MIVHTRGLSKTYGERDAVSGLDLDVPAGVISGFVGPNGAGKTTTIRMLLGLIRPTAGTGTVLDQPLERPAGYLPQVGAMIEGPAFHPGLSGRDNLRLLARAGGLSPAGIDAMLDRVGLAGRGGGPFRSYSLGMKQRLGIAAALLPEPRLLILDEPTNGLDPAGMVSVRGLLRSLHRDGMTILVSSHLLAEVEQIAGHLIMIQQGRLVFQGPIDDLVHARHPELLVASPDPADLGRLARLTGGMGWPAEVGADVLRIELPVAAGAHERWTVAAEINRRAHEAGIGVARLEVRQPTLEQAFFDLTGATSGDVR